MNALQRGSHRSTAVLLAILLVAPTLGSAALPAPVAAQRMPDADPQTIDWDVVAQALGKSGHALADQPRLFYMHVWANDDPIRLAQALRAALAQTSSKPA